MGVLIYEQRSGKLSLHRVNGCIVANCYAGKGPGRNNPAMQYVKNVGPIPQGVYRLGRPYQSASKGPLCIPLQGCAATVLQGRSGFLIHGDNRANDASEGCIIAPRHMREAIADDGAQFLVVIPCSMEAKLGS